jgi:hypothetical protein
LGMVSFSSDTSMLHVPKRVGIALIVLGLAVLGLSVFVIYQR